MRQYSARFFAALGLWALTPLTLLAQVSGNQAMRQRNRYSEGAAGGPVALLADKLALTDSTFLVGANVMQHVRADRYVAVFGLRQQAPTVAAAEKHLSARVRRFTDRVRRLDVEASGIYTDIVTQTQVHDVHTVNAEAVEYLRGFELTRNVIVPFRKVETISQLLVAAATDSIYDLVKVDYIVSDPEAVYAALFKAATDIITRKKGNYLTLTGAQVQPAAQPYAEVFASYVPAGQYSAYEAAVKTVYYDYDRYGNRQERYRGLPRLTTFYYDAPATSGYDRVINPVVTEPMVTFTLGLQVKYTLQKPARR